MASLPKIKLVYFDIEGLAEPVRLALTLSKIEFEDERITWSEWENYKATTPYGCLPVMFLDDDTAKTRTQSNAMLHYVASLKPEVGLYPPDKIYEIQEAMGIVGDLIRVWSTPLLMAKGSQLFGYPQGFGETPEGQEKVKEMRTTFANEHLPKFLKFLADYIDTHGEGKYLCGDKPSIADCLAIPALRNFTRGHIDHVPTTCLDVEPRIKSYLERFCALPEISGRYTDGIH